jgi:hypothetical protein
MMIDPKTVSNSLARPKGMCKKIFTLNFMSTFAILYVLCSVLLMRLVSFTT